MANIRKKVSRIPNKKPKVDAVSEIKMRPAVSGKSANSKPKPQKKAPGKARKSSNPIIKFYGLKLLPAIKASKQRKNIFKFASAAILIIVLFFLIATPPTGLPEAITNIIASSGGGSGFPVRAEGSHIEGMFSSSKNTFVLTDTNLLAFNKNGKEFLNIQHGYSDPYFSVSSARTLIYNLHDTDYMVTNYKSTVISDRTENEILLATISNSGNFALVTKSTGYEAEVNVFNKKNKLIYKWLSADEAVSSVLLSPNGKMLTVVTVTVSSGTLVSKIYCLNFKSANPVFKYELNGSVLSLNNLTSNLFSVVLNNRIIYYNWTKGEVFSSDLNNSVAFYKTDNKSKNIVVCKNGIITDSYIISLYNNSKLVNQFEYTGQITDIDVYHDNIYVLSTQRVDVLNFKGEKVNSSDFEHILKYIVVGSSDSVIMCDDYSLYKAF